MGFSSVKASKAAKALNKGSMNLLLYKKVMKYIKKQIAMKKILVLLGILIGFTACSPVDVVTDYDTTVDFDQYASFSFYEWEVQEDNILNPLHKDRIEEALVSEFARRGIVQVDSAGDLIVSVMAVVDDNTQLNPLTPPGPEHRYGGYYHGFGPRFPWGQGYAATSMRDYNHYVGALVVDVFDARKEELIWESAARNVLNNRILKKDNELKRAVYRLMNDFPIEPQVRE